MNYRAVHYITLCYNKRLLFRLLRVRNFKVIKLRLCTFLKHLQLTSKTVDSNCEIDVNKFPLLLNVCHQNLFALSSHENCSATKHVVSHIQCEFLSPCCNSCLQTRPANLLNCVAKELRIENLNSAPF